LQGLEAKLSVRFLNEKKPFSAGWFLGQEKMMTDVGKGKSASTEVKVGGGGQA